MDDRYNREERSYDRGERERPDSGSSGAPGDFPWQDTGTAGAPPEVWEEPPEGPSVGPSGGTGAQNNPSAVAGFVLSLVMWIGLVIPWLSFVLWVAALTFSSIGLSRAKRRGAPHKGLAIAGLCLSLIGVVILVIVILIIVGAAAFGG
ncbi:MAG: DUF4190 domain-containing protein [bacterium]|nr:DUF4190 domain-containing protein [bacterium]